MKFSSPSLLLALSIIPFSTASLLDEQFGPFRPREYPKSVAHCKAVDRSGSEHVVKDIEIHYVDINPEASRTLILVHGWPSLWSSWSNQILEFSKDYHLLVPDLRGFGSSTHPGDAQSSGMMHDIVSDLVCVLENAKVEKAICVGHDWGAQVCWEAGRSRPDVFDAIAGAVVPYIPSNGEFVPVEELTKVLKKLTYQVYFEKRTNEAVEELNKSIRRTLRGTYRTVETAPPDAFLTSANDFLGAYGDEEFQPISVFSQDEEDYIVEQYEIQGFKNTLQFYTYGNRLGSHEFSQAQGNFTIPQPALFIYPDNDPVADWALVLKILQSEQYLPHLTIAEPLKAAHWPQLEKPTEFNAALRTWLESLPPTLGAKVAGSAAASSAPSEAATPHDEL